MFDYTKVSLLGWGKYFLRTALIIESSANSLSLLCLLLSEGGNYNVFWNTLTKVFKKNLKAFYLLYHGIERGDINDINKNSYINKNMKFEIIK